MDGDDRRSSQYGPPYQPPGLSRPPVGPTMGLPTTDRFVQPATPVRSDPTRHSMTRPYMSGYSGYGYQDQPQYASPAMHGSSPMQGVELQYSPAYVQDVARQQSLGQPSSHQSYGQFTQSQIVPPPAQPSIYDTMPHYQPRQSTAIDMSSQMGTVPQYMQQGEQVGMQLPGPASHYGSSQTAQSEYAQSAVPRGQLPSQYASAGVEYSMEPQQSQQPPLPTAAQQEVLQEEFQQYEQQLRSTFESIIAGRVTEASEQILVISSWLVRAVVPLGLHHDDKERYEDQLTLWRQFNLCWEALGQKQRDITEQVVQTGRQPVDILSSETIRRIVDELVSFCDQLEPYGLVDYELGIAEEQICHIFTVCLDLLHREGHGTTPPGTSRQQA